MFFFKRKNKRIPIVFSDDYLKVPLGLEENNTIYWDMNSYRNFYVIGDTGTGKTIQMKTILEHVIFYKSKFKIILVDLHRNVEKYKEDVDYYIDKSADQLIEALNEPTKKKTVIVIEEATELFFYEKAKEVFNKDYYIVAFSRRITDSIVDRFDLRATLGVPYGRYADFLGINQLPNITEPYGEAALIDNRLIIYKVFWPRSA